MEKRQSCEFYENLNISFLKFENVFQKIVIRMDKIWEKIKNHGSFIKIIIPECIHGVLKATWNLKMRIRVATQPIATIPEIMRISAHLNRWRKEKIVLSAIPNLFIVRKMIFSPEYLFLGMAPLSTFWRQFKCT